MDVRIIRSRRRKKTVGARLVEGTLVVRAPHRLPEKELATLVEKLREQISGREGNQSPDLAAIFRRLNRSYFHGELSVASIRYSHVQKSRYGSCHPGTRIIRISHRLARMPAWVRDYVIIHEMAHLLEPNHGKEFWSLVNRYPLSERARGYLMAMDFREDDTRRGSSDERQCGLFDGALG